MFRNINLIDGVKTWLSKINDQTEGWFWLGTIKLFIFLSIRFIDSAINPPAMNFTAQSSSTGGSSDGFNTIKISVVAEKTRAMTPLRLDYWYGREQPFWNPHPDGRKGTRWGILRCFRCIARLADFLIVHYVENFHGFVGNRIGSDPEK